ncbi:hypothetical protein GCM10027056_29930 [Glaciibacter psychrotolerans]
MRILKRRNIALAAVFAVGLAVVPAVSASAFSDSGSIYKACGSASVPYLQIQSTGNGRVNHSLNGNTLESFNNGSTSQTHYSLTSAKTGTWRVFLSGVGGDITYGSAACHS